MYTNPQTSALLAHIASQTKANLDFLVSQNYLRASDAAGVLSKLTSLESESESESGSSPVLSLSERTRQLSLVDRNGDVPERSQSPPKAVMPTRRVVPPPPAPPPPPARSQQAKTLWDYSGTDPNDLSFRAGDIIEIVSETNADWWTGTINGRQGLFPSNYVEKIEARAPPSRGHTPIPVPAPTGRTGPGYGSPSSNYSTPPPPSYPAFPPAVPYTSPPPPAWQTPPPPGPSQPYGGYAVGEKEKQQPVYAPAPAQAPPIVVQQAPPQEGKKKSKFGGLGSTMANSAAGGVGFGAGAAIGAGIIDSIF